jgi:poly(3-hydroxybutyrate) depolymerase
MNVMFADNERHARPACARVTSVQAFHLGSIVGGLALLLGCTMSGCAAGSGDGSGTAGSPGAAGSAGGTSGAGRGGTTGGGGAGQAGSNQAGTGGASAGTAGSGAAGTSGVAGTTGAAGAGTSGAAGSGAGTGGRGGDAVAGRGGTGGDGGSAGAAGRAGRGGGAGTGTAGRGGAAGTGTAGAGTGGGGAGAGGSGAAVPSAGCGKTPTLKNSPTTAINYNMVTSGGTSRRYIIRYPSNYDNTHPYRLVLAYHWNTGSAAQVFDCNQESIKCYTTQSPFYGQWNLSNNTTIFVAPDGLNAGWANTSGRDVTFTDDILKQVEDDLCIDKSRIFANGFSYGAGMSFALACARPDVFRAVGIYAGGQLSGCSGGNSPVAYYATHGLDDGTLNISGGRTMRDKFVNNNGCTAMSPPEPANNSGSHICTSYQGCSAGHPVRWCVFDGSNGHDPSPKDPGQSMTWNPEEAWKFFTQF